MIKNKKAEDFNLELEESLMWICDCRAPLPDLMYASQKFCYVCGMKKPTNDTCNIKSDLHKRLSARGGKAKAKKYSKEELSEMGKIRHGKTV